MNGYYCGHHPNPNIFGMEPRRVNYGCSDAATAENPIFHPALFALFAAAVMYWFTRQAVRQRFTVTLS
ncbi:MAG TPA: hypothetical protein QF359_07370, partial [Rhodospirillales bacterium]|nr:hypothetical protein [Rhodospirillales bacterium]